MSRALPSLLRLLRLLVKLGYISFAARTLMRGLTRTRLFVWHTCTGWWQGTQSAGRMHNRKFIGFYAFMTCFCIVIFTIFTLFLLQYCLKVQYRLVAGAGAQCRRKSLIFERRLCPVLTRPRFSDCKLDDSFGCGTELMCGGKQQLRF